MLGEPDVCLSAVPMGGGGGGGGGGACPSQAVWGELHLILGYHLITIGDSWL